MARPERGGLVGLYSPTPGCGKTEAARHLAMLQGVRLSFATPMRRMVDALLDAARVPHERIVQLMQDRAFKELPAPEFCEKSPRYVLQTLGTEWGRSLIGEDFWVGLGMYRAGLERDAGRGVVFDDMRFPNEAAAIRGAGGILVRIFRPGLQPPLAATAHPSEGALDFHEFDLTLINAAKTPEEWGAYAATEIIKKLKEKKS